MSEERYDHLSVLFFDFFFFLPVFLTLLLFCASSQLQGVLRSLGMMVFSLGRIYAPLLVQYLSLPW